MRANDDLIARERSLPGLALMLDTQRLAQALGCGPLRLDYLRLKSGTSCVAAYRIGGNWLVAKAVTMDRVEELRPGPDRDGLPHRVLPELALQVMPAAADKRMRGLSEALDPEKLPMFLAGLQAAGIDADGLVPLKLKPQRRLVARLDRRGKPVAFLKIHARERFADALIAAALSQLETGPRLLHADAKSGVILTDWLDGRTLQVGQAEGGQFTRAGRLLAQVHAAGLPMPTRTGRRDDLFSVEMVIADCANLLPALQDPLQAMHRRLRHALLSQPVTPGLIHGDFSADQVLADPDKAHLIDWDRSAIGDRGSDIGCFLARLDKDLLDGTISAEAAAEARAAFLDGYAAEAPLPPSFGAQRLRHLALLLTEDFRHQRPDWDQRTENLLTRIEQGLSDLPAPLLQTPDPALPGLADALHALAMAPLLQQAGYTPGAPPRLFRHKPGRRAMIRYEAEPQPLLGKMRRKGLDRRTIQLHRDLRAAGFDGSPPLDVEVPEVVIASPELGLWAMPLLAGDMLNPRRHDEGAFFATGSALAHLHSAPVECGRRWAMADEAGVLSRALDEVAAAQPGHGPTLQRIMEKAQRMIDGCPLSGPVLLHRDFYPDQVLVQTERTMLLDLDLAAWGEPAIDLGNFLAHLQELGLRVHSRLDAHGVHAASFLAGYAAIRPLPSPAALERMREISLWRHLAICRRFADRRGYFDRLLDHASAYPH
ncbi:phosphotransferase [Paracoccus sp. (in: a-proteobacteria)]|uniref:phosphotransferase n=1 Tax=Paracoccus sp. TaxID=267 RepID=UPI0026E0DED9|nr:phosphotransferase [Paracoccus sp. (in: a-proteobacteria)]MDO5370903.1 phosphotransferase [Paracoccus sp. (in: a-proteobacteria)]